MKNKYSVFDNYVIIYYENKRNKKFKIFIDKDDLIKLLNQKYSISCHKDSHGNGRYYAVITEYLGKKKDKVQYKSYSLHSFILGFPKNVHIDHKNRNELDDRKKNLRIIGASENAQNRKFINSNNTSGYRNVCLIHGWYRIQLQIDGKNHIFPEKFKNVHDAGKFAEKMRKKYYGKFSGVG